MANTPAGGGTAYVVDNVVLAMFVDAGQAPLLVAMAGGRVFVTPSIVDPVERPPFRQPPISEFARGLYEAEQDLAQPLLAHRAHARWRWYQAAASALWTPVSLSITELRLAQWLRSRAARERARAADPHFRAVRIDPGEAECAAVAIARGWTLWSDDDAIVRLVRALYPACPVERLCGLLARAVQEGLIRCAEASDLYNVVFKQELGLWSKLILDCQDDVAHCQ